MAWSVDPMDVVLGILRPALPGVTVLSREPDPIPPLVPLVVCRQTGGSSFGPRFYDRPWINVLCWAADDRANDIDATRAAFNLADSVRRALWEAWENQTVTAHGHIVWLRESSGPSEEPDMDLAHFGRFSATYEIKVRRPRSA